MYILTASLIQNLFSNMLSQYTIYGLFLLFIQIRLPGLATITQYQCLYALIGITRNYFQNTSTRRVHLFMFLQFYITLALISYEKIFCYFQFMFIGGYYFIIYTSSFSKKNDEKINIFFYVYSDSIYVCMYLRQLAIITSLRSVYGLSFYRSSLVMEHVCICYPLLSVNYPLNPL